MRKTPLSTIFAFVGIVLCVGVTRADDIWTFSSTGISHSLPYASRPQPVRITSDRGGKINEYMDRVAEYAQNKKRVIIDGECYSACTLYLGLPRDQICATTKAKFGFHQAWNLGMNAAGATVAVANKDASDLLMTLYPSRIRRWVGKLPPPDKLKYLSGPALFKLVDRCT